MRKEFTMNDEQFAFMQQQMAIARNQRVIYGTGGIPLFEEPQEIANRARRKLAGEMGFRWDTAGPGKSGPRSFTAEVAE